MYLNLKQGYFWTVVYCDKSVFWMDMYMPLAVEVCMICIMRFGALGLVLWINAELVGLLPLVVEVKTRLMT